MEAIYISDRPLQLEDGTVESIFLVNDGTKMATLKFLQTLVDGLIECVSLKANLDMWVNEEGLFRDDFQVNRRASAIAGPGYVLKGPAVITGHHNGATTNVNDSVLMYINDIPGGRTYTPEEIRSLVATTVGV